VLYRVVQENLETWLARREAAESESGGAPAWVEGELRRYLECGILAHGFARARCAECGHDFVVAFSCKGRGVCPSCNARRMVEVAAHMVDNVFPRLPVRQWVLSFPKRLRYFLQRDAELSGRVLQVFLRAVETKLRASSPAAPADARFGGVTFVQRFGSTLNAHLHFHCCLIDGVFAAEGDGMRFFEATALDEGTVATIQEAVRGRVLDLFARNGLLDQDATANMRGWSHGGGFSLDATIRIEAWDRAGLERLLRYCARPPFASERLSWEKRSGRVVYELAKPRPNAPSAITLDPLELIDRLVVLIPPPRIHRHRYHGVLAPNARLRAAVTARANQAVDGVIAIPPVPEKGSQESATARARSAAVRTWAALLARIYEVFPLVCANCGAQMRLIAFLTARTSIEQILTHIGEPTVPPPITPARAPPDLGPSVDQRPPSEIGAERIPEIQFDQREDW
jgi:DNA-directed RNA polymerase subunit RPC12/RpoP